MGRGKNNTLQFVIALTQLLHQHLAFLFGGPALTDIPRKRTKIFNAVVFDKIGDDFNRKNMPVFRFVMRFKPHHLPLAHPGPVVRPDLRGKIRVNIVNCHRKQLLPRIAQRLACLLVDIHKLRVRPHPVSGVFGAIHRELGKFQRPLIMDTLGDIHLTQPLSCQMAILNNTDHIVQEIPVPAVLRYFMGFDIGPLIPVAD